MRWSLGAVLVLVGVVACGLDSRSTGPGQHALEASPRPVDLVWVTGAGPEPSPGDVETLSDALASRGVDLRLVVLGGERPFDGPVFDHALRGEAAVHLLVAGETEDAHWEDLDERIASAVGGPYVLHVLADGLAAPWRELAERTGGLDGHSLGVTDVDALADHVAAAAPLPCSYRVPPLVLESAPGPEAWTLHRRGAGAAMDIVHVGAASGCVGNGGFWAEAGAIHLCPSSCALVAESPGDETLLAVTPQAP